MEFWKMNGAGNDFIIINNMDSSISADRWPYIAKTLCHRHMSIGADGLMAVERAEGEADYKMNFSKYPTVLWGKCAAMEPDVSPDTVMRMALQEHPDGRDDGRHSKRI